jgi:hypothetical protein
MAFQFSRHFILSIGLVLLASNWATGAMGSFLPSCPVISSPNPPMQTSSSTRRVNAPYFDGEVYFSQAAIFWLGLVMPTENYADVRVGYNDEQLRLRVTSFDRRLWYDTSPSPDNLTAWDSVTLYLKLDGNVGDVPDANTYRFDAQIVWWEPRDDYQAAYVGDGSNWIATAIPFTTTSGVRGTTPNSEEDDRGWLITYYIPFDSLGLSGPPEQGSIWGMALILHDRDDAGGTPIPDQLWPETVESYQPATWGQLAFGMPTYDPPSAVPDDVVTIRHRHDGATVMDADVGGDSVCGQLAAPDYFSTWGELNYAGKEYVNIQNQIDVADWPCFSKYYVTFPLDTLPADSVIISATLTLHHFGNAGDGHEPAPEPSYIQVLTVREDWDEATLTWNNAPLALENISAAWVDPLDSFPGWPGISREWDVSRAVAEAHTTGDPLRLALYDADWAPHSGKYFVSSDTGDLNAEGRPTLTVTWGHARFNLNKTAYPTSGDRGDFITYDLHFLGTGQGLTLIDRLPIGASAPGSLELEGTTVPPAYDSDQHRLTWTDSPPKGQPVNIRYTVTITTSNRQMLTNMASLSEVGGETTTAAVAVIANPYRIYLPFAAHY